MHTIFPVRPRSYYVGLAIAAAVLAGATSPARGENPAWETMRLSLAPPGTPAATAPSSEDLTQLSLEDLMDLQVTSVSRQKQRLGDAAAAIYVITQDRIHHSGMNTLPDLLRMAPGMQVAQVDSSTWVVGSRGLANVRTNNMLVMMDGRTVYTPLFAGVYWDMIDYVLEDIDRIEVIRGPGATLWGSNAVNGVINITTKSAEETQGFLSTGYAGSDGYIGAMRYGGNIDNRIFYRVYSKYRTMDDLPNPASLTPDGLDSLRNGFRIDAHLTEQDLLTVQADTFFNRAGHPRMHFDVASGTAPEFADITNTDGGNLLTRYTHTFSEQSDFSLQVYYDNFHLTDHANTFDQNTADVEFQHRFPLLGCQEIIWGGGYRMVADRIHPTGPVTVDGDFSDPQRRANSTVSGFVQDDVTLIPKRLHFVAGTKLEMTPYTGFEFQPSARLIYTPDEKNTLWAGVSRAVRSPSRAENDAHVLGALLPTQPFPTTLDMTPNRDLRSEQLLALEAGYRVDLSKNLTLDMTAFYNLHHGIVEMAPSGAPIVAMTPAPHAIIPTQSMNVANGRSYGAELSAKWKPTDQLTLEGSYSFLQYDLQSSIGANDNGLTANLEHSAPEQQFQIHLYYDITKDLQVNASTYFVDSLGYPAIPAYFRTDLNVSWRPERHVELSAGVRNLFDSLHPEFQDNQIRSTTSEVGRTFFVQFSVNF